MPARQINLALTLALVIFVTGCAGRVRPPETPMGPHFRVLSFNVNWGFAQPELTLNAIRAANADVVCLQETTGEWESLIRAELRELFPYMEFRHEGGAGGLAVLSRQPIDEISYALPETRDGWFHGWVVRTQTPAGAVQLLNVHLRPSLSDRGSVTVSALYSVPNVRRQEIESHYARLDPSVPTVVLGDFNEGEGGKALQFLKSKSFANALPRFDSYSSTWRWPVGPVTVGGRFDHILYSPHLRSFDAEVVEAGASDHLPVAAVLGLSSN